MISLLMCVLVPVFSYYCRASQKHTVVVIAMVTMETRHVTQHVHLVCNISERQQHTKVHNTPN